MLKRTEILNNLIKENSYTDYLEIGIGAGINFKGIVCKNKTSVDLNKDADFKMDSDTFFKQNKKKYDIVFVDGYHLREYVLRDVLNSLDCLKNNGVIVIHDCLPEAEIRQSRERKTRNWQGDVWEAIVQLAASGYNMTLLKEETGIIILDKKKRMYNIPKGELNWKWYKKNFEKIFG